MEKLEKWVLIRDRRFVEWVLILLERAKGSNDAERRRYEQ